MKTRHALGIVLGAAIVVSGGLSWFGHVLDGRRWCVISSEWANARAQDLPANLDEYLTIPTAYRPAIWSHLRPAVRARVMQEALGRAVGNVALSAVQLDAVNFARSELTAEFYASAERANDQARALGVSVRVLNPAIVQESTEVHNRLLAAFTRRELSNILPRLMPQRYVWSMSLVRASVVASLRSFAPPVGADAVVCTCWDTSDCEIWHQGMGHHCYLADGCIKGLLCQLPEGILCDSVCRLPDQQ
jgi:hypothetical protein